MAEKNMFMSQAQKRQREQAELNAIVTTPGSADDKTRTTMTIAMSAREKILLKQFAAAQGKTTAAIVQGWINQFCVK